MTRARGNKKTGIRSEHNRVFASVAVVAAVVIVTAVVLLVRAIGRASPQPTPMPSAIAPQPRLVSAPRPTSVISVADGCLTAECHGPMGERLNVHQTFVEQACDTCHAPDTGGHVYPQLASIENTCASCHDTGADHRFQHQAMGEESCLACHDPHGSGSPVLLVADSVEATCLQCHPSDQGVVAHEPYGANQCADCHDPHGANNASLLLGGDGVDHCRTCHTPTVEAMETGLHTHQEAEGSCLGCHEAHTAAHEGLLASQPRTLCVSCHEEIGQTVAGATVSHDSVLSGDQCITCHDPHASEHQAMLRNTQTEVCLSCHDKPVIAADGREVIALGSALDSATQVHGAITIGQCSECHSVHGGTHATLLRSIDTTVFVGAYDTRNYALCFSCHDKALAESPNATQFRNDDQNLHAAHLQAHDKSGGCSDCHSVHAGESPRLIVEAVDYQGSGWSMPMNFALTSDGGHCAPGCHEPMSYSRRQGGVPSLGGSP